ncbi:MAG: NAD-dependent epimerase/dehydratase family protein [Actinomycetota bacterium]|nr:NAD-dependent epimerase/dehydratase family protein [Actinomycetota bacterium]
MRLLVLGGSEFVGRALVGEGLARGWRVTTFNRGRGWAQPGVERLLGDRGNPRDLAQLADREWDLVADTWSGAPRAVSDSAAALAEGAGRYVYISSGSVYAHPLVLGADESAPTVPASPRAEDGDYAELKRGAELAVEEVFGKWGLLARPGLILGPYENVGRLPWWLSRMALGGEILAPGPPSLPLQYIDARDLAAFVLNAAVAGRGGAYNVVSRRGHATMGSLLEACRASAGGNGPRLTWVDPDAVLAAGVEPWSELPIWIPPGHEYAALHAASVERAYADGLRCRPVAETVADTWSWLGKLSPPGVAPLREDRPPPGLDRDRERAALEAWHRNHR